MANSDVIARLWRDSPEPFDERAVAWWVEHGWSPEITWRAIEGAPDDVGLMQGTERLCRYYGEWIEMFDDIRIEVRDVRDVDGQAVASMHVTARSKSAGMPLELTYAIVHELDESGRVVSGREYATAEQAMQAAEARTASRGV